MNTPTRTATKSSPGNGAQIVREAAETSSAQTKQAFEKITAATADATNLMKDSYATAVRCSQDYNTKFIEFAKTNTEAAFEFAQQLTAVKSPTEFFELSTNHSRKQFETLTEQLRELATLAQKALSETAERVQADMTKASSSQRA
jgi:phasin